MNYRQYYRLPAGASSHISKEMIAWSFLECFQIMMFLCYFFVTTSLFFASLSFFFFFKVPSKSKYGIDDTKLNNLPCLIVIIDFEKAFDSLSRCFLFVRP